MHWISELKECFCQDIRLSICAVESNSVPVFCLLCLGVSSGSLMHCQSFTNRSCGKCKEFRNFGVQRGIFKNKIFPHLDRMLRMRLKTSASTGSAVILHDEVYQCLNTSLIWCSSPLETTPSTARFTNRLPKLSASAFRAFGRSNGPMMAWAVCTRAIHGGRRQMKCLSHGLTQPIMQMKPLVNKGFELRREVWEVFAKVSGRLN
ncbi:hypothetical protein TcWFU_003921 [Taenia crassiceps]|uniref:Uncharacterized protein n=1 Tax=Taenia crassiceps TaxID=6207 RepID=A0ABR4QGT0_9CEST